MVRRLRRDEAHLRAVFNTYQAEKISKDSLREALFKLDVDAAKGEAFDEIFLEFDLDLDGQIDFEEFKAAARRPSPIESWCKSVAWWQAVADAIPPGDDEDDHPLRAIARLSDAQVDAICAEAAKSIREILREQATNLRVAFKATDDRAASQRNQRAAGQDSEPAQSKYAAPFEASAGTTAHYHKGLSDRVGMQI